MLMNKICLQSQFLLVAFALRAPDNSEYAHEADCLWKKGTLDVGIAECTALSSDPDFVS